ncbi:unnamed protein product [Arabidopsis lyrata]|nr:unnamed protein product [Arabidopsis lyrata]
MSLVLHDPDLVGNGPRVYVPEPPEGEEDKKMTKAEKKRKKGVNDESPARHSLIFRGLIPVLYAGSARASHDESTEEAIEFATQYGKEKELCKTGDSVVSLLRVVAAGGGQNTRAVAAGGGETSRLVAAGGGETSRPVASRVRTYVGQRPPVTTSGVGASSHSSNPSATQSATHSHATRPLQYHSRHTPPLSQQTPPPQPQHQPQPPSPPQPLPEHDVNHEWEFNWDIGITAMFREGILVIAKKRMKGIVSQVKKTGVQPTWIRNTLWAEMQHFWKTTDAIERSENASQCRNSDRGGLGVHKHLVDDQGNPYGLGSLVETLHKGKRKESYASSSSTVTVVELQEQLRRKISDQDAENARRDAEHRTSQARIASLEKLILFMKEKDPDLVAFMSSSPLLQPAVFIPPITQTDTLRT